MLASAFAVGASNSLPKAAAANANLFVSAENSQFQNYFAGPMVIEVAVIDSDIKDTDKAKGEPDVTVNGKDLRMVQGSDGNWYGYFADRKQAQIADSLSHVSGKGLDFGTFCSNTVSLNATNALAPVFTDTVGVAINGKPVSGGENGTASPTSSPISTACVTTGGGVTAANKVHVVREAKAINTVLSQTGQINLDRDAWPIIQLYDFNPTGNVEVQYNKGGGTQKTVLKFDTVDQFAKLDLDRNVYPLGAQVHVTITDLQLNIDPTDEDSWTFGTNNANKTTVYQVFSENGEADASTSGAVDISGSLSSLMFEDNGRLILNTNNNGNTPVVTIQDTDDSIITGTSAATAVTAGGAFTAGSQPITITETAPNTGIFGSYDESDKSDLAIVNNVAVNTIRGKSASIDYNQTPKSIVVGFGFASLDIKPIDAEWNSGEEIPVTLVDSDANKNSRADEDLDFFNPDISLVPALQTGDPFTIGESGVDTADAQQAAYLVNSLTFTPKAKGQSTIVAPINGYIQGNVTTQKFSERAMITPNGTSSSVKHLLVDLDTTAEELYKSINNVQSTSKKRFFGFNLLNTDLRSVISSGGANIYLVNTSNTNGPISKAANGKITLNSFTANSLVNTTKAQSLDLLNDESAWADVIATSSSSSPVVTITPSLITAGNPVTVNGINYKPSTQVNVTLFATGTTKAVPSQIVTTDGTGKFTVSFTGANTSSAQSDARVAVGIVGSSQQVVINPVLSIVTNNLFALKPTDKVGLLYTFTGLAGVNNTVVDPIATDFFSYGFFKDGQTKLDRVNNQIIRIEAEETGDNTSTFAGTLEYVMLNQLNILSSSTYTGLRTIANDPQFIVHQDLDDEESPRVNYNDLAGDGSITQVSDQQAAPTHSGVVSFDKPTYKKADTVVVTLEDQDLNTDVDLIDIYTTVDTAGDRAQDAVGKAGQLILSNGDALGRLLDITFDDQRWQDQNNACSNSVASQGNDRGLTATGFTLIETGSATGVFTGNFIIPGKVCTSADQTVPRNTQGLDMEVNYVDFRDASGQIVEVGDQAGIRANTGSISLDRTVYPVPFGSIDDFNTPSDNTAPSGRSIFPIHLTGIAAGGPKGSTVDTSGIQSFETLGDGDLTIHVQVNDPDFDTSATGEDKIAENTTGAARGPVKVTVSRGQSSIVLGYAGGPNAINGVIDVNGDNTNYSAIREIGPITETAPSSGIFEFDLNVLYTDGPASTICPTTATNGFDSLKTPDTKGAVTDRFDSAPVSGTGNYCIIQGDIITVEYTDPADASGDVNTVTDSATFDLRNGALQSDKSVYIIGSDMILTLIEPDLDLDNDLAETYDLDLIEWDSDAATVTMGDEGNNPAAFDPEPSDLRETGDSTGIFQSVIEIPAKLNNDSLERGEEIVLEYTDWGPSGADYVGQEKEDVNLTIFTSNFGATVELDQKVYSWTDKVYITVVAPDQNFDSNLVDEIGNTNDDPLKVSTRGNTINKYKLVETGTDTGIFTGEVILVGFPHDVNGDGKNDAPTVPTAQVNTGVGPTDGYLGADNDDGLTVSYEFSQDETVVGSALIRWNIGEVSWLDASYPASGTGVVRVIDPDMNLNPEAVDNFNVDVWSDSDAGGIDLTVTETNESTGIFEGTVFFTTTDDSSGHRLRVSEGDTVTAEYRDETLPDPYTTADELDISGTAFIGTVVPPLERAPASNCRVVDAFGSTLDEVAGDQQVQITCDLVNGQDREQPFAYLVQVQDENGVTVSLAWITGSLAPGQSFSPALSWISGSSGKYTATVFVWESVDNPTALSPPASVDITVS